MAFDFVKKIFSFGQAKPEPAREPLPEFSPAPPETPPPAPEIPAPPLEVPPAPEIVTPPPEVPPAPHPVPEVPIEVSAPPAVEPEKPLTDATGPSPSRGGSADEAGRGGAVYEARDAEPDDRPTAPGPSGYPPIEGERAVAPSDTVSRAPTVSAPRDLPPSSPSPGGRVTVGRTVERRTDGAAAPALPRATWLQRLTTGLSRSSRELSDNLSGLMSKGRLTDEFVDELEEILIRADLGMETAIRVTGALEEGRYGRQSTAADVQAVMASEIEKVLMPVAKPLELDLARRPHVVLVVGVNGTGKTTTIGKLAAKLVAGGLRVTLAAGDTFRAAAIEQLKIWGERTGSEVVSSKLGADAAGLAYDAFEKARANGSDVLLIDTAGRLQNKAELMAELEKIVRVLRRLDPEAPHTVLQTIDATTGQNAMNQVEIFRNVAGVDGLVITKLDGTARGGILVAIAAKHRLPVYFIGVGEQIDDLEPFSARDFAHAIAGLT